MIRSWRDETLLWKVLRMLYGALWIGLGIEKYLRINDFIADVANYEIVHQSFEPVIAHLVASFEIVVGISILLRLAYRGGLVGLIIMLGVFITALGLAASRGLEISCGCTPWASEQTTNYPLGIGINVGLILFTLLLYVIEVRRPRHRFRGNKLRLAT